jgi:hypothetical protein
MKFMGGYIIRYFNKVFRVLFFMSVFTATVDCFCQTKKKDFPIMAWGSVPNKLSSKYFFSKLAEAGANYSYSGYNSIEEVQKALRYAHAYGIKIIVNCPELYSNTEETVLILKNIPGFGGYFLYDEPSVKDFKRLKDIVDKIRSNDEQGFIYSNLFPSYATEKQLGGVTYDRYLSTFFETFNMEVCSFDYYPVNNGIVDKKWYLNLEKIAAYSDLKKANFWGFAKAGSLKGYDEKTNINEIKLQVSINLAFGAKGLQYYRFWSVNNFFYNAPFSKEGKLNPIYFQIKELNKEIQALSYIFLNSNVEYVRHSEINLSGVLCSSQFFDDYFVLKKK